MEDRQSSRQTEQKQQTISGHADPESSGGGLGKPADPPASRVFKPAPQNQYYRQFRACHLTWIAHMEDRQSSRQTEQKQQTISGHADPESSGGGLGKPADPPASRVFKPAPQNQYYRQFRACHLTWIAHMEDRQSSRQTEHKQQAKYKQSHLKMSRKHQSACRASRTASCCQSPRKDVPNGAPPIGLGLY